MSQIPVTDRKGLPPYIFHVHIPTRKLGFLKRKVKYIEIESNIFYLKKNFFVTLKSVKNQIGIQKNCRTKDLDT